MDLIDYINIYNCKKNTPELFNEIYENYGQLTADYAEVIKDKFNNRLNYTVIKHIPIILLISLIICLILIILSSYNNIENHFLSNFLNKLCNLSIGATIIIFGTYLITFRLEYKNKLDLYKKSECYYYILDKIKDE